MSSWWVNCSRPDFAVKVKEIDEADRKKRHSRPEADVAVTHKRIEQSDRGRKLTAKG